MKVSPLKVSKPGHIVCPACGSEELGPQGSHLTVCDSCGLSTNGAVLRTLEQIAALPEGLGHYACECGHPEMRYLPDGVFHCPACGLEVLPSEAALAIGKGHLGPASA
jgi:ribosomal protein L37AE/L43A